MTQTYKNIFTISERSLFILIFYYANNRFILITFVLQGIYKFFRLNLN